VRCVIGHALLLVACLQGCATHDATPPSAFVTAPSAWMAPDGVVQLRSDWWNGFGDPVLSRMVDQALQGNLDLRQAVARLAEARALATAQGAASFPTLDFGAGYDRARSISDVTLHPYFATEHAFEFQAAYEVDLWGRISDLEKAANANSDAVSAARDAVALSVAASVASGYISLLALDAQLDVARRTLASRERSLALVRSRERSGYGSALESAQAEAELRGTAQTIPRLELAIEGQERALNVLLAQPPEPVERGSTLLALTVSGPADAGVPSQLVRRRPDIASAERHVVAADAQLAAARAQLLPALALKAELGRVGSTILQDGPFTVWSVGGSVLAPIFNGGRLRALVDASASQRDQALIAYEHTVLTAFAEVETQLTGFAKEREQLVQVDAQRVALEDALRFAGRRFREGESSYLDELLAQRNLFAVEQQQVQLHADLLLSEVGVYRALGGGW
jgi:NodT family efflux transporter outer membrane factor (OMF) lipoprotein